VSEAPPPPLLQAEGVVAGYGAVEILHGVTLSVNPGEIVAVIGPNGAGKSTLLKAVFGLVPIRSGAVRFAAQDVTNLPPDKLVQKGLSYVPQTENVFASLTISENLEMGAFVRQDGLHRRLDHVFGLFPDIAERRHTRAGKLSGGQRQMLALARALMLDPQLLLLDEPSASLSPKMVDSVFEKIAEINREGTAILLVEQNAREALVFSSRAYVLAMGENRFEGAASGLLDDEDVGRLYLGN
jgi:branched-chain amino acid transport system ATP-binding protein/neutral amino acid transport system ATP-binding protein